MSDPAGAVLDRIGDALEQLGLASQRLDEHGAVPIPTLLVAAGTGEEDVPTLFSLMVMPDEGTGLQHVDLVQLYFPVVDNVSAERRGEVAMLAAELDGGLPVGHVGLQDEGVALRYTLVVERGNAPGSAMLGEILGFLLPLHDILVEVVGGVADGRLTLEAARAALP